ncbi:dTMP kinase [Peribacillus frigoritolerans]|uniref:Thymidylate kinase n=1 Tax=Peribacillus castrilensis TaxID=2897690 RepID=A0AAW9NP69_9BACI|nr:dTMP kinase [Peribacillus castrilensis]
MKLIAFEGIDACGKETQAALLFSWLEDQDKLVYAESFPRYKQPIGQIIRDWLDGKNDLSDEAIHMLYEADRQDYMQYVEQLEMLQVDYMVLDRWVLSNLAFGYAKGLDVAWLSQLQSKVRKPDITIILDISPETSVKRRSQGRDRHEQDTELLTETRDAYAALAYGLRANGDEVHFINGEQSPEEIHQQIQEVLKKHFQ